MTWARVTRGFGRRVAAAALATGLVSGLVTGCGGATTSPASGTSEARPAAPTTSAGLTSSVSVTPSPSAPPQRPSAGGYVTSVPLPPRCLPASPRIVGVKVYLVQQALGLVGHRERYDAATQAAVRAFQARHGLTVDGVVGRRTWEALGIPQPYCVDRYTAQPTVGLEATPRQRIEAMIRYARARLGTPYIWGGAGPMGFDCSGLDIQAMYAGGRRVPGLNTNMHVQADFRSTQYIYASPLRHVRLAERRRGDLVFFGFPITHMAIYLGGGRILEDVRPVARVASLYADGLPAQPLVVRPFPGRM